MVGSVVLMCSFIAELSGPEFFFRLVCIIVKDRWRTGLVTCHLPAERKEQRAKSKGPAYAEASARQAVRRSCRR